MNKLAAMQTFVAIVEAGSLTAAAEDMGKALPTVVRTLANLERALGVRLLRRTTRQMSITPEGQLYFDRCRRILADVEEAEQALSTHHAEPRGHLRVTAPVLFGQLRVMPVVAEFLRTYSEVEIELLLLDRVVNLVEEGVDVGIRIAALADSTMVAVRVGQVRRVIVASPELLERVGVPQRPEALSSVPVVQVTSRAHASTWGFVEQGQPRSVPIQGRLSCNQVGASLDACVEGVGFGCFLSYQVEALVARGRLRIVLEPFEPAPIPIHVVFAHARLMSPGIRAFVDCLKAAL